MLCFNSIPLVFKVAELPFELMAVSGPPMGQPTAVPYEDAGNNIHSRANTAFGGAPDLTRYIHGRINSNSAICRSRARTSDAFRVLSNPRF